MLGTGSPLGSCNPLGGVVAVTDSRSPTADPEGPTLELARWHPHDLGANSQVPPHHTLSKARPPFGQVTRVSLEQKLACSCSATPPPPPSAIDWEVGGGCLPWLPICSFALKIKHWYSSSSLLLQPGHSLQRHLCSPGGWGEHCGIAPWRSLEPPPSPSPAQTGAPRSSVLPPSSRELRQP